MVLFQFLRSMGYVALGAFKRHQALRANPQSLSDLLKKQTFSVYAGMRMADIFGHINNARYLEIAEFARWFLTGYSGIVGAARKGKIAFVVASVDVHFLREMKPCRFYRVSTEFVALEDTVIPNATDKRPRDGRAVIMQEVWSSDGRTLHACLLTRVAFVGPADSPLAVQVPRGAVKRVAQSCSGVLAQWTGRDVAEVREAVRRNGVEYERRLGFGSEAKWLNVSQRLDREWRAKMRALKTL